jgi:hypothetical protein
MRASFGHETLLRPLREIGDDHRVIVDEEAVAILVFFRMAKHKS